MSRSDAATSYHHGDLRDALLRAGYEEISERGAETLSLRAVARRVGVSAMAPYRHYADKDALLKAIADRGFAELRDCAQAAEAGLTGGAALRAQGRAYVDFARARPALFRLMFMAHKDAPPRDVSQGPPEADDTAYGVLRARVATLAPPERVDFMALGLWGLVHGLAMLVLDRRMPDIDVGGVLDAFRMPGDA